MRLTVTFSSMDGSEFLKTTVQSLCRSAVGNLRTAAPKRMRVGFAMENGPRAEGADVFSCSVMAEFSTGGTVKVKRQAGTAYDAARACFEILERKLLENKRNIVDRRNDLARRDSTHPRGAA